MTIAAGFPSGLGEDMGAGGSQTRSACWKIATRSLGRCALTRNPALMNLKTRIKELAAKAEAVTEFARGDFALASADGVLSRLNPAFSLARSRRLTLGGAEGMGVPRRGTAEAKKLADAVRWHRHNRKLALKNLPHNVNSAQGIFEKLGY